MGVFSELDLENQQAEMEKTASKSSEIQTLQAKLIQQHEQKKAAAAGQLGLWFTFAPDGVTVSEPKSGFSVQVPGGIPHCSRLETAPPSNRSGKEKERFIRSFLLKRWALIR